MPYPEEVIRPMREELTRLGVQELRTPEAVDETLKYSKGTVMVIVNSICGCAAGKARPGIAMALQNEIRPDKVATVFAGGDIEATERARSYFTGYPPSSPSIGLLKDGQLVYMMERYQIEGRGPEQIAGELRQAFEQHCAECHRSAGRCHRARSPTEGSLPGRIRSAASAQNPHHSAAGPPSVDVGGGPDAAVR